MNSKSKTPAGKVVAELIDEVLRLRGRVLSTTREVNAQRGLHSQSQGFILTAVIHAAEPPTVARIARSLGLTRQSVQRTANELAAEGYVRFEDNPHHKRAKQLVATEQGIAAHARSAQASSQWADQLGAAIGRTELEQAVATLRRVRRYLEHPE